MTRWRRMMAAICGAFLLAGVAWRPAVAAPRCTPSQVGRLPRCPAPTATPRPLPTPTPIPFPTPVPIAPVALTFTELSSQPVDGLTVNGVTFTFTLQGQRSTDATYGAPMPAVVNYQGPGPGTLRYVQDPALEGNSDGVLTLDFAAPTTLLTFGIARSSPEPLPDGLLVELFDKDLLSVGVTTLPTAPLITGTPDQFAFTEATYAAAGGPIRRAVLTFGPNEATRFALDNLSFTPGPVVLP